MEFIIDRFEGDFAIVELEDKSFEKIPKRLLPGDAIEGSIIEIVLNRDRTDQLRNEVESMVDELFK